MESVIIRFNPAIYRDDSLHWASQSQGSMERRISGSDTERLFENIEEKIWAMSYEEAIILDDAVAQKYNQWIANRWHKDSPPAEIDNILQRDMLFALPYSERFKKWLRKNN